MLGVKYTLGIFPYFCSACLGKKQKTLPSSRKLVPSRLDQPMRGEGSLNRIMYPFIFSNLKTDRKQKTRPQALRFNLWRFNIYKSKQYFVEKPQQIFNKQARSGQKIIIIWTPCCEAKRRGASRYTYMVSVLLRKRTNDKAGRNKFIHNLHGLNYHFDLIISITNNNIVFIITLLWIIMTSIIIIMIILIIIIIT